MFIMRYAQLSQAPNKRAIAESLLDYFADGITINHEGYIRQVCFSTLMQMFSQERVLTKGHVKSIFSNYHAQLSKYDASNIGRIMYSFQGLSQEVPEVIQELIKYLNSQIK